MRRHTTSPRPFVSKRNAKRICQAAIASAAILTGPIYAQNVGWIGDFTPGDDIWTNPANWDIGFLPGTGDTAVFSLNEAANISLGGTTQEVAGLSFTQPSVYKITNGTLILNSLAQTGNANNEIQVAITTKNSGADILTTNVTTNTLQLQRQVTSGGIIKNGGGTLRLGTSGTNFTNAINGDIVINAGTLQAAANNQAGGNPLGGTGKIVIGASGVTLNLQAQANMDFRREVVANNNSFTLTGGAAAADNDDFTMSIGKISIGTATLTATAGSGYFMKTSELAINSGATTTVNTANANQHLYVAKLTGDSTTKIVKTGGGDLRIQANGNNAADFAGDIDVTGGWLVLEGNGGGQPLGNANTQITITGAGSSVSMRADAAQTFNGVNINAGNNSFNLDVREISGTPASATLTAGAVTIGNATMSVTGSRHNAALTSLSLNTGSTSIVNVNTAVNGASQNLRVESLIGDATTTFQKNGGQTLTLGTGAATNFQGKIIINGGATTVETTATVNALRNAQSLTFINGSTLNLRGTATADFVVPIKFAPGVLSSTISADRTGTSATGNIFLLGDVNASGATLTLTSGNNYGIALDSVTVNEGATAALNVTTNGTGVVSIAGLNLPATSTLNKLGGSQMVINADQSATASGLINIRAGTLTADVSGALGTGLVTVGMVAPNSAGYLPDASRLNWNAVGASANSNGLDAVAIAGGTIDLNVVPGATDVFSVQADGRIQGTEAQLQGLTIGSNLTLATNAIVLHDNPGATKLTVNGLANDMNLFYGIAATADSLPAIGVGTPWKGIAGDNATRVINGASTAAPAVITVNGGDSNPDTIEATFESMFGAQLNLGTDVATDGTYEFASPTSQKVTLAIRGTLGSNSGVGLTAGGFVGFRETAVKSKLSDYVDKIVVQGGTLGLMTLNSLNGVAVEVQNGGGLDINNLAGDIIDGPVTIKSGGVLFLNDNQLLGGSGTVTIENGGKLDLAGATPANILTASSQQIAFTGSGNTVRFTANNIEELDKRVPDLNVTYVVSGGVALSTAYPETNLTGVVVNNQDTSADPINNPAGLTIESGILTNAGANTAYVGPLRLKNTNLTIAATRGTTLIIPGEVKTAGDIQIGSLTPIDGRDKSLNSSAVNSLGVPDPYNSGSQVIITGPFAANNVVVNNSHFALANADTTINGDLTVNGAVLYLDGGGPLNVGTSQGQLTPKLAAGTLADRVVINNYSRVEMRLDLASDSNATRLDVNQPFVINGDVNPLDNRRFYVSRNSGTNNGVNFNDITMMPNSVLGVQEDNTDVRASLKLAGNAMVSTGSTNNSIDYINISRDASLPAFNGSNPVVLTQGRLNVANWQGSNTTNSNVFGKIDAGVEVNLVRGQMYFVAGSTLDGVVRTQTAVVGGDSFVVSTSNSSNTASTTDTMTGGTGRIELGRSGAANGPEDFEIRGTETQNATTAQAPLHTHTGEIRVVNDGDNTSIDGIVRSSRVNDSDRTARVQVDNVVLENGATVQLTSANAIPLNVTGITLQGSGTINTASTGMTVNTVNAGTNTVTFSGAQQLNITGSVTAGQVNVSNTTLILPAGVNGNLNVDGGTATTNGNVDGALSVNGGTATINGSVLNGLNVTNGTASFNAGFPSSTVGGPISLDGGNIVVTNGVLDLGNALITSTASRTVAGLREFRIVGNAYDTMTPNDSNIVKLGPVMGQATTATGWATNETYVYSGQFFVPNNRGDGTGSFAFAESFDDSVRILIDGTQRLENRTYNDSTGTTEINLPSGWHDVEFRFGQGTGGAGPVNADGWNGTLGFGLDLDTASFDTVATSPVQSQYIAPLDNGSMNLFRTTVGSNLSIGPSSTLRAAGFTNVGKIGLNGFDSQLLLGPSSGGAVQSTADYIEVGLGGFGRVEMVRVGDKLSVGSLKLNGDLTVAGQGDLIVAAGSAGFGSITKEGPGALILSGTVEGAVSVNGGTLGGNGTFTNGIALNSGTIAPGSSAGVLTTSVLTALSGTGFKFEIGSDLTPGAAAPGVNFDQIVITGDTIDIGGAGLTLVVSSALQANDVLTLILNNGTDVDPGVFNGIANGSLINLANGYQVQISYFDDATQAGLQLAGGNDVSVLVTIPEPSAAMALLGSLATLAGMRRFRRRNG